PHRVEEIVRRRVERAARPALVEDANASIHDDDDLRRPNGAHAVGRDEARVVEVRALEAQAHGERLFGRRELSGGRSGRLWPAGHEGSVRVLRQLAAVWLLALALLHVDDHAFRYR